MHFNIAHPSSVVLRPRRPLQADFKKKFAKMQAGSYDEAAVSAKLNGLISDTPCVMFSFST